MKGENLDSLRFPVEKNDIQQLFLISECRIDRTLRYEVDKLVTPKPHL